MKITKRQLKKVIRETLLKEQGDFPTDEQMEKSAYRFGHDLAGHPDIAKDIRVALNKRFPNIADAFWNAYAERQEELDVIYSSYDN